MFMFMNQNMNTKLTPLKVSLTLLKDGYNVVKIKWLITVVPTMSDRYVIFCLQLLSKTLTSTHHLS